MHRVSSVLPQVTCPLSVEGRHSSEHPVPLGTAGSTLPSLCPQQASRRPREEAEDRRGVGGWSLPMETGAGSQAWKRPSRRTGGRARRPPPGYKRMVQSPAPPGHHPATARPPWRLACLGALCPQNAKCLPCVTRPGATAVGGWTGEGRAGDRTCCGLNAGLSPAGLSPAGHPQLCLGRGPLTVVTRTRVLVCWNENSRVS